MFDYHYYDNFFDLHYYCCCWWWLSIDYNKMIIHCKHIDSILDHIYNDIDLLMNHPVDNHLSSYRFYSYENYWSKILECLFNEIWKRSKKLKKKKLEVEKKHFYYQTLYLVERMWYEKSEKQNDILHTLMQKKKMSHHQTHRIHVKNWIKNE